MVVILYILIAISLRGRTYHLDLLLNEAEHAITSDVLSHLMTRVNSSTQPTQITSRVEVESMLNHMEYKSV
jgi:predicted ATPase